MKIGRYYRQGAPNQGDLLTEDGTYTSPYITVDKSEYHYQKPGPPLQLRGRHQYREQPRVVGARNMMQHVPSDVPVGFNGVEAMGTLSGSLFSDSPAVGMDYAERTGDHYESGAPEDSIALGQAYAGPAMLAAKVKTFFKHPAVLALLVAGGLWIAYKLFIGPALSNPPKPSRRAWRRYKKGSRKKPPPANETLSAYARGRSRNSDGTFKKLDK